MPDIAATMPCTFCGAEWHSADVCDDREDVAQSAREAEVDENAQADREDELDRLLSALGVQAWIDARDADEANEAHFEPHELEAAAAKDAEAKETRGKDVENDPKPSEKAEKAKNAFERGDGTELAARMVKKLTGKGPALVFDDGALHRYEEKDGLWRPVSESAQSKIVQSFAGTAIVGEKKKVVRVGHADVRSARALAAEQTDMPGFFAEGAHGGGAVFANGFVVVNEHGIKLQPHDASNRARWGYEFPYVEDAQPQKFLDFLDGVFRDDADKKEKILFIQEFGGLALLGLGPVFARCLVATSFLEAGHDGRNGKSQLAEIFKGIMPVGSVSTTRPQDFDNEYRRAGLAGKLLNCVAEMPEGEILESASFKAIITGDEIEGRRIREAPFTFRPIGAHYYACNTPPGTSDYTRAFFSRFVFLTFGRTFLPTDPGFVLDIGRKIIDDERKLLPSWFLPGAARALERRGYTHIPSSDFAIKKWREGVDQVALFFDEMTERAASKAPGKGSDWTSSWIVYNAYKQWAEDSGHKQLAGNKFGERAKQCSREPAHTKEGAFYPVRFKK